MKKLADSIVYLIAGTVIALSLAHCNGCALIRPEGEMAMEVTDAE